MAKFLLPRYVNRPFDTISTAGQQGSYSFFGLASPVTSSFDASQFDVSVAGAAPTNFITSGKVSTRNDSVLFIDCDIPKYSRLLGGTLYLRTTAVTVIGLTALTLGLYPNLEGNRDIDNWMGGQPWNNNVPQYIWRHVGVNRRPNSVINPAFERANFWCQIYEGATAKAQSSVAVTTIKTNAQTLIKFGYIATDKASSKLAALINGIGQVLQMDASSTGITSAEWLIQRTGTYTNTVNLVCNAYQYNSATRDKGALVATSDPVAAGSITTSNTVVTTFTFSTPFAVNSGDYMLFTVEPQTNWDTSETATISGRYHGGINGGNGAAAVGSEEIMWWSPFNTGNGAAYLIGAERPGIYSGVSGTTLEDTPLLGVAANISFRQKPSASNELTALDLSPLLLAAMQEFIRNGTYDQTRGLMIYLATGNAASNGTITWSTSLTSGSGLQLHYRPTRTFIT